MYQRAELALVFSKVRKLLKQVIEEYIVHAHERCLHLLPILARGTLLHLTDYASKLISHLAVVGDVNSIVEHLDKLLEVVLLLVLLQALNLDNLVFVVYILLSLTTLQLAILAL